MKRCPNCNSNWKTWETRSDGKCMVCGTIVKPKDVLDVTPTKKTQEWLETVDQIVNTNFRCPNCKIPLSMGVFQILFKDKDDANEKN